MQNTDSQKIIERFFEVIYDLKAKRIIRGKNEIVRRYDINNGNFWRLEKDMSRDVLELSWLSNLVKDYGVNAEWLLTGKGKMYKKELEPRLIFKNKVK